MRILHTVEFYDPARGGAEEVVRQISEGLARRGHQVTVATTFVPHRRQRQLQGVKIEDFQIRGNAAFGMKGEVQRYRSFLLEERFDLMMNYAAQVWTTDMALPLLKFISAAKVLAPCGLSALRKWWLRLLYAAYFNALPRYLHEYDAVVYHSRSTLDRAFGDRHGIGNGVLIPNGAPRGEFAQRVCGFRKAFGLENCFLVLNVSNHHRIKGHYDLYAVLERAGQPNLRLAVIGDRPTGGRSCFSRCEAEASRSGGKIVLLEGVARPLVISAFFEADLFVLTSEVECFPLVILEAMAAGTPWISFPAGNVRELQGGLVVDSPRELAAAIGFLSNDPAARRLLGEKGRSSWQQSYTWDRILNLYESLYYRLVCGDFIPATRAVQWQETPNSTFPLSF